MADLIDREAAIGVVNNLIARFEGILRDIRESKGDDSVCGMCEYDGAYIGQSGDWCNECPGFEKNDCFRLSDKCRKRWMDEIALQLAAPSTAHTTETTAKTTAPSTDDWIPCSERLPEEDGQYLITVRYKHVDGYEDVYAEHGDWCDGNWDMFCFGHCGEVESIPAWMPLPEAYQGR